MSEFVHMCPSCGIDHFTPGDNRPVSDLTTLRAEVEALQDEAWDDFYDDGQMGDQNAENRSLGRARMAQTVLDLIDKHAREGQ